MSRWVVDVVSGPPPRTRPPQATVPPPSAPEVDVLAELLPVEAWLALDAPELEEPLVDAPPLPLDAVAEVPEAEAMVPVLPVVEPDDARVAAEPAAALDVDAAPAPARLDGPPPDDEEPQPAIIPSPNTMHPEAARVFAMSSKGNAEPKTAQRSAWQEKWGGPG